MSKFRDATQDFRRLPAERLLGRGEMCKKLKVTIWEEETTYM